MAEPRGSGGELSGPSARVVRDLECPDDRSEPAVPLLRDEGAFTAAESAEAIVEHRFQVAVAPERVGLPPEDGDEWCTK
jgi:hypothetical protein